MEGRFRDALARNEIKVYYQPILHLVSGKLCAYEALSRWDTPDRGLVKAADFLDELEGEEVGMLDTFVIWKVCETIRSFLDDGLTVVPVSIGYAVYPENGDSYKDLYQKADLALYQVKQGGKDSYYAYDKSLNGKEKE